MNLRKGYVAEMLPGWDYKPAILHLLQDEGSLPEVPGETVRLLDPKEIDSLHHVPEDLRAELRIGAQYAPVAAAFEGDMPVSFCYPGAITETRIGGTRSVDRTDFFCVNPPRPRILLSVAPSVVSTARPIE